MNKPPLNLHQPLSDFDQELAEIKNGIKTAKINAKAIQERLKRVLGKEVE